MNAQKDKKISLSEAVLHLCFQPYWIIYSNFSKQTCTVPCKINLLSFSHFAVLRPQTLMVLKKILEIKI